MNTNRNIKSIISVLLISLLVAITFWPLSSANFLTLDDPFLVFSNQMVHDFDLRAIWSSPLIGLYHPITTMSWAVDYAFWGASAKAFHLSNIAYHIINCILVFVLLKLLLKDKTWAVIFITVLFALHPVKVETVSWVSARKDLVFSLFFLVGLIAYQQYLVSQRFFPLLASILAFVLSLLSKPMAVSFPIVIFLLDLWREPNLWRKHLLRKIPLIIISVVAAYGNALAQKTVSNISGNLISIDSTFRALKCLTLSFTLLFKPENLCGFYDQSALFLTSTDFLLVSVYLLLLVIACVLRHSLIQPILLLNASFIVMILPALKLVGFGDESLTNDRYLYLSSLGLFILTGLGLEEITSRLNRITRPLRVLLLLSTTLTLCYWSQQLLPNWNNTIAFWERVAIKNPNAPRPYAMLASFYLNYGNIPQAAKNFSKAYQLNPRNITVAALYGHSLVLLKQFDEAKQIFTEAMKLAPNDAELFASVGVYLIATGQYEAAEKALKEAQKGTPRITSVENSSLRFRALTSLGMLYLRTRRLEEARIALETATAMNYDDALSYYHLGYYYSEVGRWDDAIRLYQRAISLSPNLADGYIGLGIVYWNQKDPKLAQQSFEKAVAVNPNHALANSNLGNFYRHAGNIDLAKKYCLKALELDSSVINSHICLAVIYTQEGNTKLADHHNQEAEKLRALEQNLLSAQK